MALVQVRKSDASGAEIPEGTGVRVRLEWYAPDKVASRADLTDEEALELIERYGLAEVETRPERQGERRIRLKQ